MRRLNISSFVLAFLLLVNLPATAGGKHLPPPPQPLSTPVAYQSGIQQPNDAPGHVDPLCPDPQFGEHRNVPESHLCEDMHNKQNKARHDSLKKDTDQLLELATQLKQYVDKTNENTLSLDVIKKAEEVEKLAKRVKEKMKG